MSEPKAREFWIVKDGHDYYPNVFSWKAEGPLDEKRDSKIHVIEIEYEGPRGYKSLVEAHDFQVKLNKELQSLLKQAEPEFIKLSKELKSTRDKLATCVEAMEYAIEMEAQGNPIRCHRLKEALAKIKGDQ